MVKELLDVKIIFAIICIAIKRNPKMQRLLLHIYNFNYLLINLKLGAPLKLPFMLN